VLIPREQDEMNTDVTKRITKEAMNVLIQEGFLIKNKTQGKG
jgi:hypothetical protein